MFKKMLRVAGAGALLFALTAPVAPSVPVSASAPSAPSCGGNNAFCGATLHLKNGASTVIPTKSIGGHYGPGWGLPVSANNSTGVGFCMNDQFAGVPVGVVGERPVAPAWSSSAMATAAWLMASYAGDRVSPYQGLAIDAAGELVGYSTRERLLAVHLALLSTLPNWMGGQDYLELLDPGSLQLFADVDGLNPSVFQALVPLVQTMVAQAAEHSAGGAGVVIVAEETVPGVVTVTVTKDGVPVPNVPVWPSTTVGVGYTGTTTSQAYANAVLVGWPALDYSVSRAGAGVTDSSGVATFSATVAALNTGIDFHTEEAPGVVHNFGDGVMSQDNLTWLSSDIRHYVADVGRIDQMLLASQVSDATPSAGSVLTDGIRVEGLADGVTVTVAIEAFDLEIDPLGSGTPLVSVQVAGLGNGWSLGHAPIDLTWAQHGHRIGYRHRAVSMSDGSMAEPGVWSELGLASETAVVGGQRSELVVSSQTCAASVTVPRGRSTAATCDRITVHGDPGDVVTGTATPYPWGSSGRMCDRPGPVATWQVTLDENGVGTVQTSMVEVPVGSSWEWIESASTTDGRTAGRDCATSPRAASESFAVRPFGGRPNGGLPDTGASSAALSAVASSLVVVGVGLVWMSARSRRRPRPAIG